MSIQLKLSTELRRYCHGHPDVELQAATIGDVLLQIERLYPELFCSICHETGAIRPHVNLFVNDSLVRVRGDQLSSVALRSGDVLGFFPAVSGG